MNLYEHTIIARQDTTTAEIKQLTEKYSKIVEKNQGEIVNDNSDGQIVVSGKLEDLKKMMENLKASKIKNIQLPVSAPFHCSLMEKATENMREPLNNLYIELYV